MNKSLLNNLVLLYVEDEQVVQETLHASLLPLVKEVYVASNGQEALELFLSLQEQNLQPDCIVSDINMPILNGIELLEQVRKLDDEIPFIFTTAYSEKNYLLDSIRLNATDYILKPINSVELIKKIYNVCSVRRQNKLIRRQKKELERYLTAIDKVAIISKTDLTGKITFANQIFCDVAGYTKDELVGQPHNIIRHPDMPSEAFKVLWETIQAGHTWQGKVKNQAKDGSAYYVNATIIPLYDEVGENIVEYIAIRFLTTDDELIKREFKKKVMQNIQENKRQRLEDAQHIKRLEQRLENSPDMSLLQEALKNERKKSRQMMTQIMHYENELKEIHVKNESLISTANDKLRTASKIAMELKDSNHKLSAETNALKDEIETKTQTLMALKDQVYEQTKVIHNLRDVIDHREEQLELFKSRES